MSYVVLFFMIASFFFTFTLGLLSVCYLIKKVALKHKSLEGKK